MRKGRVAIVIGLVLLGLIAAINIFDRMSGGVFSDQAAVRESTVDILVDVTRFSRITEDQLVDLLGEPDAKEDWTNQISDTQGYNLTRYDYVIDEDTCYSYEFCTNDAGEKLLVYMMIYFDYNGGGSTLGVGLDESIFARLGISSGARMVKEADSGVAIRWSSVSDKVHEVWAQSVSSEENLVDWVKIKFDPKYPL